MPSHKSRFKAAGKHRKFIFAFYALIHFSIMIGFFNQAAALGFRRAHSA